MVPFRVFDRAEKKMWQVLNYHPGGDKGGYYLVTREDDSENDGEMQIIAATTLVEFKFIEFIEESDPSLD